jgi:hypothetical protein
VHVLEAWSADAWSPSASLFWRSHFVLHFSLPLTISDLISLFLPPGAMGGLEFRHWASAFSAFCLRIFSASCRLLFCSIWVHLPVHGVHHSCICLEYHHSNFCISYLSARKEALFTFTWNFLEVGPLPLFSHSHSFIPLFILPLLEGWRPVEVMGSFLTWACLPGPAVSAFSGLLLPMEAVAAFHSPQLCSTWRLTYLHWSAPAWNLTAFRLPLPPAFYLGG